MEEPASALHRLERWIKEETSLLPKCPAQGLCQACHMQGKRWVQRDW